MTPETQVQAKKPDVTQPGVLPPPQEAMKQAPAVPPGTVVPAGGVQANATPTPAPAAAPAASSAGAAASASLTKFMARFDKKVPATEMAVAWQNRIAYLPDPTRNGAQGAGIAGQMFLFGGPKLQFVEADGTLTVDLIDETLRPAGQKGATPERWQFNKEHLKKLRAKDETFGESYVLFLPWPAYRPDITRVRISARYDPETGNTLFAQPSVLTIDKTPHGAPVWDGTTSSVPLTPGTTVPRAMTPNPAPTPLPPSVPVSGSSGAIPIGGAPFNASAPAPLPPISTPIVTHPPMPLSPIAPQGPIPPAPDALAPKAPEGLPPLTITIGKP
jgi:hypothetical protein